MGQPLGPSCGLCDTWALHGTTYLILSTVRNLVGNMLMTPAAQCLGHGTLESEGTVTKVHEVEVEQGEFRETSFRCRVGLRTV